jgi:hypothetical protein
MMHAELKSVFSFDVPDLAIVNRQIIASQEAWHSRSKNGVA